MLPQQSNFPGTILSQTGKQRVVQTLDNPLPTLLAVLQGRVGMFPLQWLS